MSFSCKDHVVPGREVPPIIFTLDPTGSSAEVKFNLQFSSLGNLQVTEYGFTFLFDNAFPGGVPLPDVLIHDKLVVDEPVDLQVHSKSLALGSVNNKVSVRAYAKLSSGGIVYGQLKKIDFGE